MQVKIQFPPLPYITYTLDPSQVPDVQVKVMIELFTCIIDT